MKKSELLERLEYIEDFLCDVFQPQPYKTFDQHLDENYKKLRRETEEKRIQTYVAASPEREKMIKEHPERCFELGGCPHRQKCIDTSRCQRYAELNAEYAGRMNISADK